MKFRTDFVTNSSSSSFVTLNVNSKTLCEILDKYNDALCEDYCAQYSNNDGSIELCMDEAYADVPYQKNQIIDCITEMFEMFDEEISDEITNKKEEILGDLKEFKMEVSEAGWQGDSEARYYKENYSKKQLKEYYKEIAEKLGCSVEDVTDDDFFEFVSDKTSIEETTAVYNPETGKMKVTNNFYLEDY